MARPLPAPTLADALVDLRPWRPGDARALAPACGDADICRFTTVPTSYSPGRAQAWIVRQQRRVEAGAAVVLAIVPAGAHLPVGMVGLYGLEPGGVSARFGYWLIRSARGRGLASAAIGLLGRWAFDALGLDVLLFDIEPENAASKRVATGQGAELVGEVERQLGTGVVVLVRYRLQRPPESARRLR